MTHFIPKRVLAVTPHADDVTLFAGGTLALWIENGCRVSVLRVTQDEKDSFEHGPGEAAEINGREFREAMEALGVHDIVELGYQDCELMDVPYGVLREKLIRAIREFRPEVIVSFDPTCDDENPDHEIVAKAAADAAWAAGYPNFHPEHREQGLMPHIPLGLYYFTRHFVEGETAVDISSVLSKKLNALCRHQNMLCTMMEDQRRRLEAAGHRFSCFEEPAGEQYEEYWRHLIGAAAKMAAQDTGYEFAERFRSTLVTEDDPLVKALSSME